jgi:2,4-dienoyl-CoA reductase-like NADH-dependent reductase (Old Yellow Enzyme family)
MDLSPLFTPFKIRNLELANRFILPAMQRELSPGGVPSREMAEYYRRRIEGGLSLIIGEATAVDHPSSTHYWKYARLFGPALDGWKRVLDNVKEAGGKLFLQLWHEGAVRKEGQGPNPEAPTLSPSGLIQKGEPVGQAMSARDLIDVRDAFASAAQTARAMGFDGIEIHGAHGYLLDQFLWHETNQRDDGYGGSLENRLRYPCEIVRAVRGAIGPDMPISFRMSQWKERNFDGKVAQSPAELAVVTAALRKSGVDIFHASTRRFWIPEFEGSDRGYAGWVKSTTDAAVITVGSVGLDNDIMSSLHGQNAASTGTSGLGELLRRFNNNEFDLIAVGRAALGDPDWVNKVRDGRFAELEAFDKEKLAFLTL